MRAVWPLGFFFSPFKCGYWVGCAVFFIYLYFYLAGRHHEKVAHVQTREHSLRLGLVSLRALCDAEFTCSTGGGRRGDKFGKRQQAPKSNNECGRGRRGLKSNKTRKGKSRWLRMPRAVLHARTVYRVLHTPHGGRDGSDHGLRGVLI